MILYPSIGRYGRDRCAHTARHLGVFACKAHQALFQRRFPRKESGIWQSPEIPKRELTELPYIFTFCRGLNPLETYGSITFCVGNRTPLPVIRLCHRHKSFPLWRNLQRLFFTVDLGLKYLKIKLKISYQPTKGKDFVLREFSIATHTIRYRIKII